MFTKILALIVLVIAVIASSIATDPLAAFDGFVWPVVTRHGLSEGQLPDPTTNTTDPTTIPEAEEGWYVWNYFGHACGAPCSKNAEYPYHPGYDLNRLPVGSGRAAEEPVYSIGDGLCIRSEYRSVSIASTVIIVYDLPDLVDFQPYALEGTTLPADKRYSTQVSVQYLHLEQESLAVKEGQRVIRGQFIGLIDPGDRLKHLHLDASIGRQWSMVWYDHSYNGYYQTLQDITTYGNIDIWKVVQDFQYPWNKPVPVAVGQFAPGESADDNISQAFKDKYATYVDADGFNKLGAPAPDRYSPYVFTFGTGIYAQQLLQPDASKPQYTGDASAVPGLTWLIYSPDLQRVFLITPTFLDFYGRVRSDGALGAPVNDQRVWADSTGVAGVLGTIYLRQDFSFGKTLLATSKSALTGWEVTALDWPDEPVVTAAIDGVGGAEPFTLTGWAVTNSQVFLSCRGNLETDANGWYSWLRDGVEVAKTGLPELTQVGLTPGATYVYSVQAVDDVWGPIDTSNTHPITLPPAEEFSLSASLRTANAVSLSIVNRRFPVVGYYRILRNGFEIGQLIGEALGDFGLAYATTYAYQAVALTSSNLELGRSNTVSITTGAPSAEVPPPEALPTSIQLSVDRIELRASERGQASALVLDQYGRPMLGMPVYFISANSSIASIDADWGTIIADHEGRVDLHAELVADRNLWSPLLTLIVQRADWTPPVPPAWHVVGVSEPLQPDSFGRHWSDPSHSAWVGGDSTTWVTLPHTFPRTHQYWMPQHFSGGVSPLDGFTWYLADGRLGVYFQTIHGLELWVNGIRVGAWGNPYGYGAQPINLPSLGNSLTVPPVEITPYLNEGLNHLVLYVTAGFGWPELRHLEFVNLNGAPALTAALPNLVCRLQTAGEPTAEDLAMVTAVVENLSPAACGASTLALSVDAGPVQTFLIPELAASGTHRFDVNLGALPAGVHTLGAQADSEGQIAESDEGDNLAQLDLTVLPVRLPDLVLSLHVQPRAFINDICAVDVTVENLGEAPSPPCQLQLGCGGQLAATTGYFEVTDTLFIIPALEAYGEDGGGYAYFSTYLLVDAEDTVTVWAEADAGQEVRESDESDNLQTVSVLVTDYLPNLIVKSVAVVPAQPTTSDVINFQVTVANIFDGNAAASVLTAVVPASIGFMPIDLPVPPLPAGTSTVIDVSAGPYSYPGGYGATFIADRTNLIQEMEETDNQKSVSFTVVDPRPDLIVNVIKITRRDPTWIQYDVEVLNAGQTAAPLADIVVQGLLSRDAVHGNSDDFGVGGPPLATSGSLNPGQRSVVSQSYTYGWGFDYAAYQYLTVKVDWLGKVVESNETNNTLAVRLAQTGTTLFSDNFESGLTKWRLNVGASGSTPVVGRRSYPYGGKLAANGAYVMYLGDSTYGTYATATAEFTVNLTGYTQAVLEFDWTTYSLYSPEFLAVDLYDGSWRLNLATTVAAGWRHVSVDLSEYRLTSGVIIRFRSYQDWPESSDAAYLDNVKLTAK